MRNTAIFFSDGSNRSCPCDAVNGKRDDSQERFLVMANQNPSGEYVANLILPWKKEKVINIFIRGVYSNIIIQLLCNMQKTAQTVSARRRT